mgnify:CR=1 FL=1
MTTKQIFTKAKDGVLYFLRMKYNKYIIVLALGVFIVGFLGDYCVVAHVQNKARISELKAEISHNLAVTKSNQEQISKLQHDPKTVEKVGRERYFMKADDEDVFVLSDDEVAPESIIGNETVE